MLFSIYIFIDFCSFVRKQNLKLRQISIEAEVMNQLKVELRPKYFIVRGY